jgi:Tannase and feruloyl esterase
MAGDSLVHNYFRHFEAPGVGHCYSASGLYPSTIFDSLVNWVEKGQVPDRLEFPVSALTGPRNGKRILCPYPQRARYNGSGDAWAVSSFHCA